MDLDFDDPAELASAFAAHRAAFQSARARLLEAARALDEEPTAEQLYDYAEACQHLAYRMDDVASLSQQVDRHLQQVLVELRRANARQVYLPAGAPAPSPPWSMAVGALLVLGGVAAGVAATLLLTQ